MKKDLLEEQAKKQMKFNMDMAKKEKIDKKIQKEQELKNKEKNDQEIKENKRGIKLIYAIFFSILVIFVSIYVIKYNRFFSINYYKNLIVQNKKLKNAKPDFERIELAKNEINKRNNNFKKYLIENGYNPKEYNIIVNPDEFVKYLEKIGAFVEGIDIYENIGTQKTVIIANKSFEIKDFEKINKNKYLKEEETKKAKETANLNVVYPNIIFTRETLINEKDEILIPMFPTGGADFNGLTDKNLNPLVIGYDYTDGDITDKIEIKNLNTKEWKHGEIHKITYKLTNSKGKTVERVLTVKCAPNFKR